MHPLVTLVTAAAGLYTGVRLARKWRAGLRSGSAGNRFGEAAGKSAHGRTEPRDMGDLKLDRKAGLYRPSRR